MKKLLPLLLLLCSCTKQDIKIVTINEERIGRVELHVAILNDAGHRKFGNKSWTLNLQDGDYVGLDSSDLVNQLFWDNAQANHNDIFLGLNNDSYIYDTAWIGLNGNKIIEVPVSMFYLSDTVGVRKEVEDWVNNGYAHWSKKELNSHYDFIKLIMPNI